MIYNPKRFPSSEWKYFIEKGYRLSIFLGVQQSTLKNYDAEAILKRAWAMFASFDTQADSYLTIAKISAPDGRAVCLKVDRDYFYVTRSNKNDVESVAEWQFAFPFRGHPQESLWLNMVSLLGE